MHAEAKAEHDRHCMVASAFTAWQLGAGAKGQNFGKYLDTLGLSEDRGEQMTEEDKKDLALRIKHIDKVCRKWHRKNVKRKKHG